jgi:diaminopimelate epimerase
MQQDFFKYQSLGNDFILFDFFKKPFETSSFAKALDNSSGRTVEGEAWSSIAKKLCNRHFGIGADGVLVLLDNQKLKIPQVLIFNADGSQAEICLNGLRCVAHHLYKNHNFPAQFKIEMGSKLIDCQIEESNGEIEIVNKIPSPCYFGEKKINVNGAKFCGHVVNVGNPHFVVLQEMDVDWLKKYGHLIEGHKEFAGKTNVEFVWQDNESFFNMLVYERGCGLTLACSSGATAVIFLLNVLKKVSGEEKVFLQMLGGELCCWIEQDWVVLQAKADLVFNGVAKLNY